MHFCRTFIIGVTILIIILILLLMICFVSTDCDRTVFIRVSESTSLSTELYPRSYLPGLDCRFRFNTVDSFWLRIDDSIVDLSGGSSCTGDFFDITGIGTFCRYRPLPGMLRISSNTAEMVLHTGVHVDGRGLHIRVSSICKKLRTKT